MPYVFFSWLLLSVILFVQQASRYSDIFFSANIPASLVWQLAAALIPNVIAFTCPMAVLVGVIIGLSRMQGDSELVAIRAAGVGNLQATIPVLVLGILLSIFAFIVNLYGVPLAASAVRAAAMRAAILKLESPIEPGVFNTEVAGYTIYVKDGDIESGTWRNIFVHAEDPRTGAVRLITSSRGRIDYSGEQSELVLEDAVSTSFNTGANSGRFVSEKIGEIRFSIRTRRGELVERLSSAEVTPEELGLSDLSRYASAKEGRERVDAQILWQRRVLLSLTPLIFSLLGTALVLRFNRGGRGFGIFMALLTLLGFYLFAFVGEQAARSGTLPVWAGSLVPIGASVFAILWFNFVSSSGVRSSFEVRIKEFFNRFAQKRSDRLQFSNLLVDVTTGIRDLDLVANLVKFYLLSLAFLASVFIIFTAFELWRFAGSTDGGYVLLGKYLFYLLPFVYLQLAPSAAMIAVLATYVIKSRQNEIVTWTAAGQSVYRLLFPAFGLMLFLGIVNLGIQEALGPTANVVQDEVRNTLRSRGTSKPGGKLWIANDRRIYSFVLSEGASDNEMRGKYPASAQRLRDVTVYEFGNNGELQDLYRAPFAVWSGSELIMANVDQTAFHSGRITTGTQNEAVVSEDGDPFVSIRKKPSQLTIGEAREQAAESESKVEQRLFAVALEKKYSTAVLPFVIALFTAPFALSLSRKGKVLTVGYAVGLWLVFMGTSAVFDQLGLNGSLPPWAAIWLPPFVFSMLGVYLLSRVRT